MSVSGSDVRNVATTCVLLAFGLLLGVRLYYIFQFEPLHGADTKVYIAYANLILQSTDWIHEAGVSEHWRPITAYRIIGYPAVLALFNILCGEYFEYGVTVAQSALSMFALYLLYVFGVRLGLTWVVSLIAVVMFGFSHVLVSDISVLTDSFFTSIFLLVLLSIANGILERRPPRSLFVIFLISISMALCFLLREATIYALPAIMLGIVIWAFVANQSLARTAVLVVLVALPSIVVYGSYHQWNEYRTGRGFVTIGGQNLFIPVLTAASLGEFGFEQNDMLARAYDAIVEMHPIPKADEDATGSSAVVGLLASIKGRDDHRWGYQVKNHLIKYLFDFEGVTAVESSKLGWSSYRALVRVAPMSVVSYALLNEYWPSEVVGFLQPINFPARIRQLSGDCPECYVGFMSRLSRAAHSKTLDFNDALWVVIEVSSRIISSIIITTFVLGGMWRIFKVIRKSDDLTTADFVGGWILVSYVLFIGMYCVVHMEPRFGMAIHGMTIIIGLYYWAAFLGKFGKEKAVLQVGRSAPEW